jgi:glycosyltransferase involved in cell wall biosynthesis
MGLSGPSAVAVIMDCPNIAGCAHWRIWGPYAHLVSRGYRAEWTDMRDPMLDEKVVQYGLVVLPRWGFHVKTRWVGLAFRQMIVDAGGRLVFELDDDLFSEGFEQRLITLHNRTAEQAREEAEVYRWALTLADGVTVSTPYLAALVRQYVDKPIEVIPNAIDVSWYERTQARAKRTVRGLTVGWMGGLRPDADVSQMAEAWRRLARRYPALRFVVQGYLPEPIKRAVGNRLTALPWMDVHAYPRGLVNVDIGCCPLADTPFNRAKSAIKAYEWAVTRAPVVASPLLYSEVITHGENGYIAHDADEWEFYLSRLVESTHLRRQMSRSLYAKVKREHSLAVNLGNWPAAYQRLADASRV